MWPFKYSYSNILYALFGLLQRKIHDFLNTTNVAGSICCKEMEPNTLFGMHYMQLLLQRSNY